MRVPQRLPVPPALSHASRVGRQIVLAGTLSFEILDRFVGEWTVLSTAWGSSLFTPLVQDAPLLWFILSLVRGPAGTLPPWLAGS